MDEGIIVGWLKNDGDEVGPGDLLLSLESEKATENIEAIDPGILRLPPDGPKPGDKVQVGQVLAYLTAKGEHVAPGETRPLAQAGAEHSVLNTEYSVLSTKHFAPTGPGRRGAIQVRAARDTCH